MTCIDPNDYNEPRRPKEVSARPEWPTIHELDFGWNCYPVYSSVSGDIRSCCIYEEGGYHTTEEECIESTICEKCEEPEPVMDWKVDQGIYDSQYVGTFEYGGPEGSSAYVFMEKHFAPWSYYYIGDHEIYSNSDGVDMDPDKRQHTYIESAFSSCDINGENCVPTHYSYTALNAYAPRTLYKQTNTRFMAYDRNTLAFVKVFDEGHFDSNPTWNEKRSQLLKQHSHNRPVLDPETNEYLGTIQVFTEYNPYYSHYPDYSKEYSYADWKFFNEHPDFVPPASRYMAEVDLPNESLVLDYIEGDAQRKSEIKERNKNIEELVEWYKFQEEGIEPPGWVEGGWPLFFKGNNRFSWEGQFEVPLEKIMSRKAKYYEGITLGLVTSNLAHLRSANFSRLVGKFSSRSHYFRLTDASSHYTIRVENENDRQYVNNGSKLVIEDDDTGDISITDIPIGVQNIPTYIIEQKHLMVINPIRDNAFVSGNRNSLFSSTTPSHCYNEQLSINGAFPLYSTASCAYKDSVTGEYYKRYFHHKVDENENGEIFNLYVFYQPKGSYSGSGAVYSGDFEGGNGEHYLFSQPFSQWLDANIGTVEPAETNVFIPFKPTTGPNNASLEPGVVIPLPTAGPSNCSIESGIILPPQSGPYEFRAISNFYAPPVQPIETGPTDITLQEEVPATGPSSIALFDRSNPPATGPATTVLLEIIYPPVYGPNTLSLSELPPSFGPSQINLIELAPQSGPSNIDIEKTGTTTGGVTYLIPTTGPANIYPKDMRPTTGPANIYPKNMRPSSGPDSIDVSLLPFTGPVDAVLNPAPPSVGPENAGILLLQEPYDCFSAPAWSDTSTYATGDSGTIVGLTSGATSTQFTVQPGNRRISVAPENIYTSHSGGLYQQGEKIKFTNSSLGLDGYYHVYYYVYTAYNNIHKLYLNCANMMPMSGPSAIDSVVTYEPPNSGPSNVTAIDADTYTGPPDSYQTVDQLLSDYCAQYNNPMGSTVGMKTLSNPVLISFNGDKISGLYGSYDVLQYTKTNGVWSVSTVSRTFENVDPRYSSKSLAIVDIGTYTAGQEHEMYIETAYMIGLSNFGSRINDSNLHNYGSNASQWQSNSENRILVTSIEDYTSEGYDFSDCGLFKHSKITFKIKPLAPGPFTVDLTPESLDGKWATFRIHGQAV